jgi:beta-fructofuranosidase
VEKGRSISSFVIRRTAHHHTNSSLPFVRSKDSKILRYQSGILAKKRAFFHSLPVFTLLRFVYKMAFNRFRPTSHYLAPHSWMNDPCGAVYVPETQEYLICYQWYPGHTDGGNSAWGMARSKDLVTWIDCTPAIQNGPTYDCKGVFSGSIVSRLIDGKRVLFLFYTSVSAVPIHWSLPYIEGCESQSVAVSTDFGNSWHRYEHNPLLSSPPHGKQTTGWRDPFVSRWENLSRLLGVSKETNYMMLASGERGKGSHLQLYQSDNLLDWTRIGPILDEEDGAKVSPTSQYRFGKNSECASFFTINGHDYLIVGQEEDKDSPHHNGHCVLWFGGNLVFKDGKPHFEIKNHGMLDHGISYAAHIFRDAEGRLIQLGWADETAKPHVVRAQGWAGCLAHPRELHEISKPLSEVNEGGQDLWRQDVETGVMTTLGFRPAPQLATLKPFDQASTSLKNLESLKSTSYELNLRFTELTGRETLRFNLLESEAEVTQLIVDLRNNSITIDRDLSSVDNLGVDAPDSGSFHLLPDEDLDITIFVDKSIIEIFVNDRFTMTSRVYPSSETSNGLSCNMGGISEENITIKLWDGLKAAWRDRRADGKGAFEESHPLYKTKEVQSRTLKIEPGVSVEGVVA